MQAEYPEIFALNFDKRLELVEALWDSIAASPESIPVPDWQKQELDRRAAEFENNPTSGLTWDQVMAPQDAFKWQSRLP